MQRQLAFGLICMSFLGCGHRSERKADVNYASRAGLNETSSYSIEAEQAIIYANAMLGNDVKMRFIPTWAVSILSPKYECDSDDLSWPVEVTWRVDEHTCTFHHAEAVPVYLIDDDKLGAYENLFVPEGERCVFVNTRALRVLWDRFGMRQYEYPGGELSNLHPTSIAIMLLHEMGHLFYGDSGSYTTPMAISVDELKARSELISNKEVRADKFAVEQIIAAPHGDNVFLKGAFALDNDYVAGNMFRVIKAAVSEYEVGQDVWGIFDGKVKTVVLSTTSYSHPNLFFRFQLMDYTLDPTNERLEHLKFFLGPSVIPKQQ